MLTRQEDEMLSTPSGMIDLVLIAVFRNLPLEYLTRRMKSSRERN